MPDLASILLLAAVSLLSAGLGLWLTLAIVHPQQRRGRARVGVVFADAQRRYEFREGYLISPLEPNDAFLNADTDRAIAFDDLRRSLTALSSDVPGRLSALLTRGEAFVVSGKFGQDAVSIAGRAESDRLILTVGPADAGAGRKIIDGAVLQKLRDETEELRQAIDLGCAIMWRQAENGQILWVNAAYFTLLDRVLGDRSSVSWPVPDLFADAFDPPLEHGSVRRCRMDLAERSDPIWFEVSAHRQADGSRICAALPIDRLIAAETAHRNFVQTLSQTFAHLPVGLAVFNRRRELILFNPALVTQSTLRVEFLSGRPKLESFLDALRDQQRMPEPKNYRSWRDEIARLERGAEDGSYQEVWTLPSGQTFRVIGRPHPDGAVAFMFEDITAEVSLTQKFRGDLGVYQSVLDGIPGALAVFSNAGVMVFANSGYETLWGDGGGRSAVGQTVAEATDYWMSCSEPTDAWSEIRGFGVRRRNRSALSREVLLRDGRALTCHVGPLSGGAMLVCFVPSDVVERVADLTAPLTPLADMAQHPQPQASVRRRAVDPVATPLANAGRTARSE